MVSVSNLRSSTAIPEPQPQPNPYAALYNALSEADRKAIDAIERFIEAPPENSRVFTVTPPMAAYLRARYNHDNRPKKPGNIGRYATDMVAKAWALTGDTLKFSDAARLRDGQNRLEACEKANTPFRTHIVFGVPDRFFSKMDQGKNRDGKDLLAIEGVPNASSAAAAIRWAEMIGTDSVKLRLSYTAQEILELCRVKYPKNTALHHHIPQAKRIYKVTQQPVGMVAAMLYYFARVAPADAADFAAAWESGKWGGRAKALALLQKRLTKLYEDSNGRVNDVVRAALIIVAWNAFRGRQARTQASFMWSKADPFPAIQ